MMRCALAVVVSLALPATALGQSVEEVQRAIEDDRVIVVDPDRSAPIPRNATPRNATSAYGPGAYDPGRQLERQMAGARMLEAHRREQERERTQMRLVWAVLMLLGAGVAVARTVAKKNAQAAAASRPAGDDGAEEDEDLEGDDGFEHDDDFDDLEGDGGAADDEPGTREDRDARYDEELARLRDE